MREPLNRRGGSGRRGQVGALALAALLLGGLSACGGGDDEPDLGEGPGEVRGGLDNEAVIADPAIVIDGLGVLKGFLNDIKNEVGSDKALETNDAMVPVWEDIEGRIKSEDPDAHEEFETQFIALAAAVEAKEKDKARTAADALILLSDNYLAGKRTTPTVSPTSTPSPTSTVIPSSTATLTPTPTPTVTVTGTSTLSSPGSS